MKILKIEFLNGQECRSIIFTRTSPFRLVVYCISGDVILLFYFLMLPFENRFGSLNFFIIQLLRLCFFVESYFWHIL